MSCTSSRDDLAQMPPIGTEVSIREEEEERVKIYNDGEPPEDEATVTTIDPYGTHGVLSDGSFVYATQIQHRT